MKLKALRTILKTQKYPKMVVGKGIEKALAISQEQLRSEKPKKKDDILPFISTYNPNNPKVLPKVREIYRNLQTSKTFGKIFAKHKLIDSERQRSNLKKLLCSSNFSSNKPTFKTTKCGKSCFCCDYIIEAELFKFKNWQQLFILKSNFNCETLNLIYVIICSGCKKEYIGQTGGQLKERLSIYRQQIRQPEYEKIEVKRYLWTCAKEIFKMFSFFKMRENNKILRECYVDHFIKKFQLELNRRLSNPKN